MLGIDATFRLRRPRQPLSVEDWHQRARRRLPSLIQAYVDGGADGEVTQGRNTADFRRWVLRQRLLSGVTAPDITTIVLGTALDVPFLVAPTGLAGAAHWHGDLGLSRAAERVGTRLVLSSASVYSIEEVAGASAATHWFQLYPWRDRDLTGSLMGRAARAGFETLVVTVDVPVYGNRLRERRVGMTLPPTLTPATLLHAATRPAWCAGYLRHRRTSLRNLVADGNRDRDYASFEVQTANLTAHVSWDDLGWIRDRWRGGLLVKGITDPEDAQLALARGADGIVVSNHGGRQLDRMTSAIAALPAVRDACGPDATILFDGGVRDAADVVVAQALGANACLLGRPVLWGLAAGGTWGAHSVLEMLRADLERTLTLMGVAAVGDLGREHLQRA